MADEVTTTATETTETTTSQATETTESQQKSEPALSSEAIQKMIQSAVDSKTAALGKTIAELREQNKTLQKANMTAEEIQKADKEEFEKQKAEVELGKRQIHAHRVVATAGYGENAEAVVDIILGDTDEKTDERLKNFKSLVDKIVAEKVQKTFKENGRNPNGGSTGGTDDKDKKDLSIAEKIGKKAAETAKKSNAILDHYYGGKK